MPRPRKCRTVAFLPQVRFFKPQGIPLSVLKGVALPMEGLEALRLADAESLDHEAAALRMGISRPTFSRVLSEARSQVARALVNGWAIRIEGGDYRLESESEPDEWTCFQGRRRRGSGRKAWELNDIREKPKTGKGGDEDA